MQQSASAGSLLLKDEFDHIFTDDQELVSFLERVNAAHHAGDKDMGDVLLGAGSSSAGPAAPISLQFLPPEPLMAPLPAASVMDANGSAMSSLASFEGVPGAPMAQLDEQQLHALQSLQLAMTQPSVQYGPGSADGLMPGAALMMPPVPTFGAVPSSSSAGIGRGAKDTKPQISHSTVEKQRRDRINALIDELRELVPPSKATLTAAAAAGGSLKDQAANTEARRPKHVVLADTISLLKQLQTKVPLTTLLAASQQPSGPLPVLLGRPAATAAPVQTSPPDHPTAAPVACVISRGHSVDPSVLNGIKDEHITPTNSNSKGSVSSQEDVNMKDEVRPKLPNIPIQPTMMSGVMVERGPDCMYVQVKCRDRKGLLLDIINALKVLPLEVRTAAVTTQPDGMVRDVFEVSVDDSGLQPEDVQNMVHEALFQQYVPRTLDIHKRARC